MSLALRLGLTPVAGVFVHFRCDACGLKQYHFVPLDDCCRILTCPDCGATRTLRAPLPPYLP